MWCCVVVVCSGVITAVCSVVCSVVRHAVFACGMLKQHRVSHALHVCIRVRAYVRTYIQIQGVGFYSSVVGSLLKQRLLIIR